MIWWEQVASLQMVSWGGKTRWPLWGLTQSFDQLSCTETHFAILVLLGREATILTSSLQTKLSNLLSINLHSGKGGHRVESYILWCDVLKAVLPLKYQKPSSDTKSCIKDLVWDPRHRQHGPSTLWGSPVRDPHCLLSWVWAGGLPAKSQQALKETT